MSNKEKTKIWAVLILLVLGLSALSVGAVLSSQTAEEEFSVLIQKRGLTTGTLRVQGYNILADYDEFVLVETTSDKLDRLLRQGYVVETLDNGDFVSLQSYSFNVKDGEPNIPVNLEIERYPEDGHGYYIVQFIGPIKMEWQDQLQDMGVRLHEFRNRYNFIVEMNFETMRKVERLNIVNWVGIYQPAYKFDSALLNVPGIIDLEIETFNAYDTIAVAQGVEYAGAEIYYIEDGFMIAQGEAESIIAIANMPQVISVSKGNYDYEFLNSHATWITQTNDYGNRKVTDRGVTGIGELVTVCDSELYTTGGGHEMWYDTVSFGDTHRKVQAYYSIGGDLNDGQYHGSHVTGSVLGDAPPYNTYNNNDGNAIGARLIFQDIGTSGGGLQLPSNMYTGAWQPSYDAGSRAHTNSWGGGTGNPYGGLARVADEFIWDHKDYNILFAAGNDGDRGAGSISEQGQGKNLFTVGAAVNYNSHNNIASFSSRGYASDGRIKPTVVHIGQNVNSASRSADGYSSMSGTSMSAPGLAGQVAQVRHYYAGGWYPSGSANAGDGFNPSNALVRATIINGAVEITGTGAYETDARFPNSDQGYGRSMLDRVMHFEGDARKLIVFDSLNEGISLSTGQSWSMEFEVEDASMALEATIAWTDFPGANNADPAIVNDLDLELFTPGGTRYVGNAFTGYNPGYSQSNPTSNPWNGPRTGEWDGLNVEENILLLPTQNGVEAGVYELTVTAHQVSQGTQPFAVVITGGVVPYEGVPGEPPEITVTRPNGGETFTAGTQESITWTTIAGDAPVDYIDLWYSVNSGDNWIPIDTNLPDTGTYTWTVPNEDSSNCLIRARATDTEGRRGIDESDSTFTIVGSPPAPPTNLAVEHYGGMTLVVFDDFQDGNYDGWSVISGDWSVEQSGGNYWLEGQGQISTPHTQAYGRWEWDFQMVRIDEVGGSYQLMRFFFIQNQAEPLTCSGYYVIVTGDVPGGGQINLWRLDNGNPPDNPLISGVWDPNTNWNTLAVERGADNVFTMYLNDDIVGQSPADSTYTTSSYIGFRNEGPDTTDRHRVSEVRTMVELDTEHNRLTWGASPDDPLAIAQYNVYRSETSGGTYEYIGSVGADGSATYEYIDEFKGTADEIIWWYIVRAEGINGLEEQNTNAVPEPGEEPDYVDIPLNAGGAAAGWNFVSFNLMPLDTSLEVILDDIDGNYDKVMYYDANAGEWLSYVPGRVARYNNFHSWNHRMGIWIHMTITDTLRVEGYAPSSTDITLYPGWTMVSLPSESTGNHGLPGEIDRIGYFDASAEYNLVYNYNPGSFAFEPLRGYWIHNPNDTAVTCTVDY